jgi:hypothetical protein
MALNYQESNPIVIGSGELYICKFSEIANPSLLTEAEEALLINIGAIKEDAVINISKDYAEIESTNRGLVKKISSKTKVKLTAGVITFVLENVAKFLFGSTYTVDDINKTKKMIIGTKDTSPECYIRFINTDKETGKKLIVNIYRAVFDGEQDFSFGEDATKTNYEFSALAVNIDGKESYVEFIEDSSEVA